MPNDGRVFADAAGENNGVRPAHFRKVGTDVMTNAMAKDIDRQFRSPVLMFPLFVEEISHVVCEARQSKESRLFVQKGIDFLDRHSFLVHEKLVDGRINITRTGTHHKPRKRGHSHRGIDRVAAFHRANGAAVSKMQSDDVDVVPFFLRQLPVAVCHIPMGGAVKSVSANLVPPIELIRDCIQIRYFRHGCVKRRIKNNDLRNAGSEQLTSRLNAFQIGRVVKRRKVDTIFNPLDHIVVNNDGPCKLLAPVNHPVPDGMYVAERANGCNIRFCGNNPSQQVVESSAVIAQRGRLLCLGSTACLHGDQRLASDSFDNAFRQLLVFFFLDEIKIGFDDLEFEGRGAAIKDEDVHEEYRET